MQLCRWLLHADPSTACLSMSVRLAWLAPAEGSDKVSLPDKGLAVERSWEEVAEMLPAAAQLKLRLDESLMLRPLPSCRWACISS